MMNIELARILQADREREIEAALRSRHLLQMAHEAASSDTPDAPDRPDRPRPTVRHDRRPASSAVAR